MLARSTALAVACGLLLTLAAPAAVAPGSAKVASVSEPSGGPACLPGEAFENDEVRLWFQGLKAHVVVEDKREGASYVYQSAWLAELAADGTELRTMHIGHAFPHESTCSVTETEDGVVLSITITEDVREAQGGSVGLGTVELRYAFNASGLGTKFDLVVHAWPWADGAADHVLAYDFDVASAQLTMESADNGIGLRNSTGDKTGYVEWARNATATYDDSSQAEANVTSTSEGTDHERHVRLTFANVAGGYAGLLLDPWVGLGDWIIVAGQLIGLGPAEGLLPDAARDLVGRVL
ncbi:MAG TPA: hypothetical protein VGR28_14875 [Candidatus Thermoplasmatota archaeon]|nr:hypothetical protein [Candidatus Thermoplasmatota archaeon]